MPSRPGIAMSSSNRSGDSASVRLIAESPSLAVPTSCAPSARASRSCSRSAASHRTEAAAGAPAEPRLEALAHVREADAGAFVGRGGKLVLAAVLQLVA